MDQSKHHVARVVQEDFDSDGGIVIRAGKRQAGIKIMLLERDGKYWGPPQDGAAAIRELKRMQQAGAAFIVVAWDSFWWLDHYADFHRYMRLACPCLLENERVVIFQLTS